MAISGAEAKRRALAIKASGSIREAALVLGLSVKTMFSFARKHKIQTPRARRCHERAKLALRVIPKSITPEVAAQRIGTSETQVRKLARRLGMKFPRREDGNGAGCAGERAVRQILINFGFNPKLEHGSCPWDITCGPIRVEVKTAVFSRGIWVINIHRHNRLQEDCDFYVLRLENGPLFRQSVHLVVPAPLKIKTLWISQRTLMAKWAVWFERFDLIKAAIKIKTIKRPVGRPRITPQQQPSTRAPQPEGASA